MIINDEDCTLEELTFDDFPSEPQETAQYIIAQASLSRIGKSEYSSFRSRSTESLMNVCSRQHARFEDISRP